MLYINIRFIEKDVVVLRSKVNTGAVPHMWGNCEVKVIHYKTWCWYNAYGELLLNYIPVKPQQIGS